MVQWYSCKAVVFSADYQGTEWHGRLKTGKNLGLVWWGSGRRPLKAVTRRSGLSRTTVTNQRHPLFLRRPVGGKDNSQTG
jgi:hypothetical protein